MIKLLKDKELAVEKWKKLSLSSPYSSFFQTKECYDFYRSLSFMDAFLYGVQEKNELKGVVCGYILSNGNRIKRYFSRRAIVHAGPLLAADISETALNQLLQHIKEQLSSKSIYVEFRNNFDYSKYQTIFETVGFSYQPYYNYQLKFAGTNNLISQLSKSKKRQIRLSQKAGVEIIKTNDQRHIEEFYKILTRLYKKKIKKPLLPKEFFQKIVSLPGAYLLVALYKGEVVSGMACVGTEKEILYEWLVGGDDGKYKAIFPSVSITYGVMEYALQSGFAMFDFMGAGSPNQQYGVREFKEKFGGELVEHGRFLHVNKPILYAIGKTVLNMNKRGTHR